MRAINLKKNGIKPLSIEGVSKGEWALIDIGDIIIHIFIESTRKTYALDELWANCKREEIPQEYYVNNNVHEELNSNATSDYF